MKNFVTRDSSVSPVSQPRGRRLRYRSSHHYCAVIEAEVVEVEYQSLWLVQESS